MTDENRVGNDIFQINNKAKDNCGGKNHENHEQSLRLETFEFV